MATGRLQQVQAIDGLLRRWGYTSSHLKRDFPLNVSVRRIVTADIAAFGDVVRQDTSTAAIVFKASVTTASEFEEVQKAAAVLGAPISLIGDNERLSIWSVASEPRSSIKLHEAEFSDLSELFGRIAELGPEALSRIKTQGAQPSLFPLDVGLLDFARKTSREYLTQTVEQLVASTASLLGLKQPKLVTRMAIGAIAVVMLRDKGLVDSTLTGGALIDAATARFAGYLNWVNDLPPNQLPAFGEIVEGLQSSLSFAGLESHMVSDVYEQALVTQTQRRMQGTFYTPPQLARQMMRALPLEEFAPEARHVLDPACGSGTLLIAAADRLRAAAPALGSGREGLQRAHAYVTGHLRGFDQDYFATEVSKLALLLAALPIGNSWQVEAADLFSVNPTSIDTPSIIVSNPPWQNSRVDGRRVEEANRFLSWMLEALKQDGYLACVLPQSWIEARSNRDSRTEFFGRAELLDFWRLPTEVFPQTSEAISPIVVVARKRSGRQGRPTLVKTVNSAEGLQTFYRTGRAFASFLADPGLDGQGLITGQVRQYLEGRADMVSRVRDVAVVRNGRPHRPGRPLRTESEANCWEISSLDDLPAFGQPEARLPVLFPEDFSKTGASSVHNFTPKKLVVSAKRWSTRDPWRFKVGIDLKGFVPREAFHIVRPIEDASAWHGLPEHRQLHALLAILGSGLANCWVDEFSLGRNMSPRAFDSMPIPNSLDALESLAEIGERLVAAASNEDLLKVLCRDLETIVTDVYGLPSSVQNVVAARLGGNVAPEGGVRYPISQVQESVVASVARRIPSFGEVLDVDMDKGLRLWVSGSTADEGEWVGIPGSAYGWLAVEGMDFVVESISDDLSKGVFSMHQSEWRLPSDAEASSPLELEA